MREHSDTCWNLALTGSSRSQRHVSVSARAGAYVGRIAGVRDAANKGRPERDRPLADCLHSVQLAPAAHPCPAPSPHRGCRAGDVSASSDFPELADWPEVEALVVSREELRGGNRCREAAKEFLYENGDLAAFPSALATMRPPTPEEESSGSSEDSPSGPRLPRWESEQPVSRRSAPRTPPGSPRGGLRRR
eukprot:1194172-Alexandrium_andersonii.AAC.1